MSRVQISSDRPRSIAVLRALNLGDLLCAVPALRALRAAAPQARVTLIGLPWAREFCGRLSRYLDEFIEFPGYPGLPERDVDIAAVPRFLDAMQQRSFDLAIQLHGSGPFVNECVTLIGAKRSAGFFSTGGFRPDPDSFMPYPEKGAEVERLLRLMNFLGAPNAGGHLEFPRTAADFDEWQALSGKFRLRAGRFVCVHPGARWPSRRWPAERFARVADALSRRGFDVVLTGSRAEKELTDAVQRAMKAPVVDLAGATSLGGLAALLGEARLLVCNDTGVSHLASALGVRSIVVSCGSDLERWSPEDPLLHTVLGSEIECRPCDYAVCPIGHPCALAIEEDAVVQKALEASAEAETIAR